MKDLIKIPAWKLRIEPEPFMTAMFECGMAIPTFSRSSPGPLMKYPFKLMIVASYPSRINPSIDWYDKFILRLSVSNMNL